MKMRTATIIGSVVLLVALTALAGPAYAAGNGKGNGQGNGDSQVPVAQSSVSGKPADAPGQVKKEHEPPVTGASAVKSAGPKDGGHPKSGPAGSPGVKPSSSTEHNVSATAGSSATKLYGNGQTAGQIAIHHGATSDAVLYGPGNSQPHKVLPCGRSAHGNGGGPDVHALKSKGQAACDTKTPPVKSPHDPSPTPTPQATAPRTAGSKAPVSSAAKGSVKDVPQGGVMSSVANAGKGSLPFTGLPLWSAVLLAAALAGTGFALRRQARETA